MPSNEVSEGLPIESAITRSKIRIQLLSLERPYCLIELGVKPIILERGKDVQTRRRDIAETINKDHIVNPESNYCFGEGGAGTYSDGKLYTRSSLAP